MAACVNCGYAPCGCPARESEESEEEGEGSESEEEGEGSEGSEGREEPVKGEPTEQIAKLPVPPCVGALIGSFLDLAPGVPANEVTLRAVLGHLIEVHSMRILPSAGAGSVTTQAAHHRDLVALRPCFYRGRPHLAHRCGPDLRAAPSRDHRRPACRFG
jgi:hypothetical protein